MSSPKSPPPGIPGFTYSTGIGAGGFADVFLYTQHSTGRGVAVKVLRSEHLSDASLSQFEVEARVMAGVSTHPYIVTIHDAGIAPDGRPYLVMEHYPQPHFGTRARGGNLPISEVLRVGVQVCSAVETAHRVGILHRDIKPANILTSAYGDPGLTDFGIAGVQTEAGMSAATGVSYGFSAPEVVLDGDATGSVSSDVYALGATVYALLVGRTPIHVPGGDNSTETLARRVANGDVQPLRREDVPRTLTHLLNTTLGVDPTVRPPSAEALAQALRDVEQELRLPPTALVVTGSVTSSSPPLPPRPSADDPADATRRAPRVVHAHEETVPPQPPQASSSHRTPEAAPPPGPTQGPIGSTEADATVARAAGPVGVVPRAPIDGPARGDSAAHGHPARAPIDDGSAGGRFGRRTVAVAGATSAAVLVVLLALLFAGGGNDADRPSTTAVDPGPPQDSIGPGRAQVLPPGLAPFERASDGSVTLRWGPPADAQREPVRYTVFRNDPEHEDQRIAGPTGERQVTLSAQELAALHLPGDRLCVVVVATLDEAASNPSDEQCIDLDPDPGASEPTP